MIGAYFRLWGPHLGQFWPCVLMGSMCGWEGRFVVVIIVLCCSNSSFPFSPSLSQGWMALVNFVSKRVVLEWGAHSRFNINVLLRVKWKGGDEVNLNLSLYLFTYLSIYQSIYLSCSIKNIPLLGMDRLR